MLQHTLLQPPSLCFFFVSCKDLGHLAVETHSPLPVSTTQLPMFMPTPWRNRNGGRHGAKGLGSFAPVAHTRSGPPWRAVLWASALTFPCASQTLHFSNSVRLILVEP
eukprot:3478155-Amphidinium_carterae.1